MGYTYSQLVDNKQTDGSIKNWANRTDIPSSTVLMESEAFIYERLRVREMQAEDTLTFSSGGNTGTLPTGFVDPIQYLPYSWGDELPLVSEDLLAAYRDSSGDLYSAASPSRWTVIGTTAYCDVSLSADFSGKLIFFKTPTALSGGNSNNFLTDRYPTLLRYACMGFAFDYMKDQARAKEYKAMALIEIENANVTNELWRRGQYA